MNKGSHGVGLNVCKKFAIALGGDLTLSDEITNGCQFVVSLNLRKCGQVEVQTTKKIGFKKCFDKKIKKVLEPSFSSDLDVCLEMIEAEE